jgi:hypothetical protein
MAMSRRLMIAADMRMICNLFFNVVVMDVEREFSAFDGTGGSLKGRIKQNSRYSLANTHF